MAGTTAAPVDHPPAAGPPAPADGTASPPPLPIPAVGDTLHVRWDVEVEDGDDEGGGGEGGGGGSGGVTRYWWPATVTTVAAGPPPVVGLTYGAAAGFPASTSTATLVSASRLADASGGGVEVAWRPAPPGAEAVVLADDDVDAEDEGEGGEGGAGGDGGGGGGAEEELTMADVEAAQAALDAASGEGSTVHAAGLTAFGTLPAGQQVRLAAGYRALADGVKARLRGVLAERGEGGVVTEADVREIMESVKEELAKG